MTPVSFIIEAVLALKDKVTTRSPTAVLEAIAPLLLEFAQSDEVLTDERRAELQSRVHSALRAARVIPMEDL